MKKAEYIKEYRENIEINLKHLTMALDENNINEALQYIDCKDCPLRYDCLLRDGVLDCILSEALEL